MLPNLKLLEVPVNFVEGESISLSEAKEQVHQSLAAWYSADLEEFPAAAPEEVSSTDVLAGDLENELIGTWQI